MELQQGRDVRVERIAPDRANRLSGLACMAVLGRPVTRQVIRRPCQAHGDLNAQKPYLGVAGRICAERSTRTLR